MNSRAACWLCLGALAIGAAHARAAPPAFVAAQVADTPEAASLEIRGELAAQAATILGHAYPQTRVAYWRAADKTVWILDGRGKRGWFKAGFVVAAGRIVHGDVLEYRESRGREIRSRGFLRQFDGASLRDGTRDLDRRIDGITGATISVNAMRNLARLALLLDAAASGGAAGERAGREEKRDALP